MSIEGFCEYICIGMFLYLFQLSFAPGSPHKEFVSDKTTQATFTDVIGEQYVLQKLDQFLRGKRKFGVSHKQFGPTVE